MFQLQKKNLNMEIKDLHEWSHLMVMIKEGEESKCLHYIDVTRKKSIKCLKLSPAHSRAT